MAIEFDCACGKRLSVPEDAAGRKAKCPACGALQMVPGETPPPPEEDTPETEGMMDRVAADYAAMKDRAPELSRVALGIGIWGATAMLLMLVVAFGAHQWISLIFVWLPQIAFGAWMAWAILKLEPNTPARLRAGALVVMGADWVMLLGSAASSGISGVMVLCMVVSLASIAGFGFLFYYFERPEVIAFFKAPEEPEEPEEADAEAPAEKESETL